MALEELKEEKFSMQRELLKYEARYGRPSTKEAKQIMREIYDRYRAVKRLLSASDKKEYDEVKWHYSGKTIIVPKSYFH